MILTFISACAFARSCSLLQDTMFRTKTLSNLNSFSMPQAAYTTAMFTEEYEKLKPLGVRNKEDAPPTTTADIKNYVLQSLAVPNVQTYVTNMLTQHRSDNHACSLECMKANVVLNNYVLFITAVGIRYLVSIANNITHSISDIMGTLRTHTDTFNVPSGAANVVYFESTKRIGFIFALTTEDAEHIESTTEYKLLKQHVGSMIVVPLLKAATEDGGCYTIINENDMFDIIRASCDNTSFYVKKDEGRVPDAIKAKKKAFQEASWKFDLYLKETALANRFSKLT